MYGLALLGAIATIVALYYYLVLSSRMYVEAPEVKTPVVVPTPLFLAILICAIGTVLMGVYPEPWVRSVMEAARGLF
jgi:NADH:ubiquinone oxidoreductase subunit 2 (subunit N)